MSKIPELQNLSTKAIAAVESTLLTHFSDPSRQMLSKREKLIIRTLIVFLKLEEEKEK